MNAKNRHAELIARCESVAPACVGPLWVTITHAPDNVLLDVADTLAREHACADARLSTILAWLGHADGDCPICWMLVGRLVFTIPEPVQGLQRALAASASVEVLNGAAVFLSKHLEPRHARPAGVERERLSVLAQEVRALPSETQATLLAHWTTSGRDVTLLTRRFE